MSVNLESVLKNIQTEKNAKLKPENIKYGVEVMGVKGIMKQNVVDGGDVGESIYTQPETPAGFDGLWLNTDKTFSSIYIESEKFIGTYDIMRSDDATTLDDDSNIVKNIKAPADLRYSTYCQKGNVVHIFGSSVSSNNSLHYMYDYDTNTWTRLADCPTPQTLGYAEWINDTIHIFGCNITDYSGYYYKYYIETDTWELVANLDESGVTEWYNNSNLPLCGCYDGDDIIYLGRNTRIFRYKLSTNELSFLVTLTGGYITSSYLGCYGGMYLRDGKIHTRFLYAQSGATTGSFTGIAYDIVTGKQTNSISVTSPTGSSFIEGVRLFGSIAFITSGNNYNSSSKITSGLYNYESGKYIKLTPPSNISTNVGYGGNLVFYFESSRGPAIVSLVNTSYTIGVTLYSKEYDFDENTLVINTGNNGASGAYSTQLFTDNKLINGRLKISFDDVSLYDAEEKKLKTTITTYCGNGTDWVKIK